MTDYTLILSKCVHYRSACERNNKFPKVAQRPWPETWPPSFHK